MTADRARRQDHCVDIGFIGAAVDQKCAVVVSDNIYRCVDIFKRNADPIYIGAYTVNVHCEILLIENARRMTPHLFIR